MAQIGLMPPLSAIARGKSHLCVPDDFSADPHHLLHVFSNFGIGGTAVRMARIINHLGNKYRHSIISLNGCTDCRTRLRSDSVVVSFPASAKTAADPIRGVSRAVSTLHRLRPNVLLTYNWGAMDWAFAHRLWPVCPHVHFEDGFGPEEANGQLWRRVLFRRLALRRSWRVVVPSKTLQEIATEIWNLDPRVVALIPNGVDSDRFEGALKSGARTSDGELIVGTVAPLRTEKNLARLIRAFADVCGRHQVRLVLGGEGPERQALTELAQSLAIADRVCFLGHVDAVERVLASFDIYALSSDTEQMPISLLEAMAAGKPVAAVDVGDVKRMLSPANRPFVVDKDDGDALVRAIELLLGDPTLRARLGELNQHHVREHYPISKMFQAYDELFATSQATHAQSNI